MMDGWMDGWMDQDRLEKKILLEGHNPVGLLLVKGWEDPRSQLADSQSTNSMTRLRFVERVPRTSYVQSSK